MQYHTLVWKNTNGMGSKVDGKKRNNLNIQAWRAVVDSWGRIEQCFKHYKINSQVYKGAVWERSAVIWQHNLILFIVLHVLVTNRDSLPLLTQFTQKTHGCSICQDPVIPHWQLIEHRVKDWSTRAQLRLHRLIRIHPSNQTLSNGFRGLWIHYGLDINYPAMTKNEHTTSTCTAYILSWNRIE